MIFIAGTSIALFISALLLVKKDKSSSDIFLLLWMLLNALHLGFYAIQDKGDLYDYPHLLGIQLPFPLLQGVLLYFYVASVTNQLPEKKWAWGLHLLPAILSYAYLSSFFLLPASEKIEIFKLEGGDEHSLFMAVLFTSVVLSGIIYVAWCSYLLIKHKKNIRSQFSDIEKINLSWLLFLVIGLGIVWFLVIFTQSDSIIYQAVAVFVILVGFFGVQQKNIFKNSEVQAVNKSEPDATTEPNKYAKSGLTEDRSIELYEKLQILMEKEAVYKQQELSIGELAGKLDTHPNYLSQVINVKTGKSFYDFINSYRVEDFKKMVADSSNSKFTMLALAYECGFNSKSSFNRYFKKATGLTPTQYQKQLN